MAVQKAIATVLHKGERINVPYIYSSDNSPCAIKIPNVVRGRGNFTFQMTSWNGGCPVEISIGDQTVTETIPFRSSSDEGVKTVVHFVDAYAPDQALYIRFPTFSSIAITDLQLEVSTTDSDWRPAPEDEEEIARQAGAEGFNLVTATEVFNKLTNNGEYQGLYMQDGQLYVNATYIKSGVFSGASVDIGDGSFVVTEDGAVQMATTYTDDEEPQPVYGYIRIDGRNNTRASIDGKLIKLTGEDGRKTEIEYNLFYIDGRQYNNTRGGIVQILANSNPPGSTAVPSLSMTNASQSATSILSPVALFVGRPQGGSGTYTGHVVTGELEADTLKVKEIASNGAELANTQIGTTSQSWSFSAGKYKSLEIIGRINPSSGTAFRYFTMPVTIAALVKIGGTMVWSQYVEGINVRVSVSYSNGTITIRMADSWQGYLLLCYGYL